MYAFRRIRGQQMGLVDDIRFTFRMLRGQSMTAGREALPARDVRRENIWRNQGRLTRMSQRVMQASDHPPALFCHEVGVLAGKPTRHFLFLRPLCGGDLPYGFQKR